VGEDRQVVIREVQQLITSGNPMMQMIGTSIITALMEYATTVKSSDFGLPWEIHISKHFKLTYLQNIFSVTAGGIISLLQDNPSTKV